MTDELHKHGRFFDVWAKFYRAGPFGLELRRIQRGLEEVRIFSVMQWYRMLSECGFASSKEDHMRRSPSGGGFGAA